MKKAHSYDSKVAKISNYIVSSLLILLFLLPLIFLFINSFKSQSDIMANPLALPKTWDFSFIQKAAKEINYLGSTLITFLLTLFSVSIIVVLSSISAWILARTKTRLSNFIFLFFVLSMLIPFQSLMFPMLKILDSLDIKNYLGLLIMYVGFGLSLAIFFYHGFIKTIPVSIEEAAIIDGASLLQTFFLIVFPVLKTITVTVVILNVTWVWNDYLLPYLVIGNQRNKTLVLQLYFARQKYGQYGNQWDVIFPAVLISMMPIIVLFFTVQKQFIHGMTSGAVKG